MQITSLIEIVHVDEGRPLVCQAPECGRPIFARVHVVQVDSSAIKVIGSGCFKKLAGGAAKPSSPSMGGSDGTPLSAQERDQMLADTALFVARRQAAWAAQAAARCVFQPIVDGISG
jgi:hypothetical protein